MPKYSIGQEVLYEKYKNPEWEKSKLSKPLTIQRSETTNITSSRDTRYWFKECQGWMNENDLMPYNSVGCRSSCPNCIGKCSLWESV